MVEKRTCDYTGDDIEPGTGTMFVKTDGTVLHFKDSKAEKNYLLGREARDLEWTTEGRRQDERARAARERSEAAADAAEPVDETDASDETEEADVAEPVDDAEESDETEEPVDTDDEVADADADADADSDSDSDSDDEVTEETEPTT